MNNYTQLLSLIVTSGGSVLLTMLFNRSKAAAEVSNIVGKTYLDALENLRKEVSRLEKRVKELESELIYWQGGKRWQ